MTLLSSLRLALLGATIALPGASAQAGPLPTNVAAMKSMIDQNTTEVRWRGGYGYRGIGLGYRGGYRGLGYRSLGYRGFGYRGWGYRRLGYGVAGAVIGGAIARSAYYGGYYGDYPAYGYTTIPYDGYGYGGGYCPPYGGYASARYYYGW